MTTVLIWLGSGFAFSVGVIVGVKVFVMPSKSDKLRDEYNRESVELMRERNEIDREVVESLDLICVQLKNLTRAIAERREGAGRERDQ